MENISFSLEQKCTAQIFKRVTQETHWDINTTSAPASAIGSSIASTSVSELETSTGSITLEDGSVVPVDRLPETLKKHFCIMGGVQFAVLFHGLPDTVSQI